MAKRSAKTHRVPEAQQASLLDVPESRSPHPVIEQVRFDVGDRARLFVGAVPLRKYLEDEGLSWVLKLAELLEEVDWKPFERSYFPGGRPALHPRLVMGLVLYGMMLRQPSLRQLEALARRDVGAWWLSGGLTPDFTTFTKFIKRHREVLSEDFFVKTTWLIVKRLKLGKKSHDIGIDGTVMQAAASTAAALKKEALVDELAEAKANGDETKQLEKALEVAEERVATRKAAGKTADTIVVSPTEPEAVFQPQKKDGDFKLSYKPAVAAHPSGLIVGQSLSPSSETELVPSLLHQHQRVFDALPQRVLADAGFSSLQTLALFVHLDIDALVPSGKSAETHAERATHFPKSKFPWDEDVAAPRCPAGLAMKRAGNPREDRHGNKFQLFRGSACATCELRAQCTKGIGKRELKVFQNDELKVAMAEVMRHPQAKKDYRRRAAIVEPVFARLRANGLTRFRRRGTSGVRVEFALHCVAHNLRLLLWSRSSFLFAVALVRLPDASWGVMLASAQLDRSDDLERS